MLIQQVGPRSINNLSRAQKFANRAGIIIPDKISRFFEMNQSGSLGRIPLLVLALIFVLGARFVKSRDNHERREVLTRDTATIGTAMLGVPVLKNWMQRGIDKLSKIPVAIERNKLFALDDFGFDNVKNWYSKADMLPDKALSVAKFIKERGGDVAKAFSHLGDEGKGFIKTLLNGKELNSNNIVDALETAYKSGSGETKAAFDGLTKILSNPKNGLVKMAQIFKAIPNIASLVTITTFLGYGIPAFNIWLTRKKLHNSEAAVDNKKTNTIEPAISDTQKNVISAFLAKS